MEQLDIFGGSSKLSETAYLPQTDLKALYNFAKEQAKLYWDRDFDISIELVNRKWRRYNGLYIPHQRKIRMSSIRNKTRTWEQVKGTLLHELVHWHMYTSGQPYYDSDREFALECLRVGAPISGTKIAQKTADKVRDKNNN